MEGLGKKLTFIFILATFLSACSATKNKTSSPTPAVTNSKTTTPAETEQPLSFIKENSNQNEVLATASVDQAIKTNKLASQNVNDAQVLLRDKVNLTRYTFDLNNPIYIADFKNALLFGHDKSVVSRQDVKLLNSFAKLYESEALGKFLYIVGHTDSSGSENYNYSLSARRAQAVVDVLIKGGVGANKLKVIPAGEHIPKASNRTKQGKQVNRRVEVISSDSRALIQSYLRQIKCPQGENCPRKLLNIYDIRTVNNEAELDINKVSQVAIFSPEINDLEKLARALRSNSSSQEQQLLEIDDQRELLKMGMSPRTFVIERKIRPVLRLVKEIRQGFRIPDKYIVE